MWNVEFNNNAPRIKICCISSHEEANLAIINGANAIGLVGKMPSGPGPIDDELIREIATEIPSEIDTFLLTSETTAEGIIRHYNKVQTTTIQIVDAINERAYAEIRSELPQVKLVQVVHVTGLKAIQETRRIAPYVDAVLLDSGNPGLKVKELGGTGRTHDWSISRRICETVDRPVFLAGGLTPENVRQAYDTVLPYGLDVCSGLRTDGRLDEGKLRRFMGSIISFEGM